MQQRLGGANVGPLPHQSRRKAHGQIFGQVQRVERERRNLGFGGRLAHQHGELMIDLVELGFERRDRGFGFGHGGLAALDLRIRRASGPVARFCDRQFALVDGQQLLCQFDLLAELRLADGRRGHVAGQHEPRPFELPALVVALGLEPFNRAPVGAEDVERIRDGNRSVE